MIPRSQAGTAAGGTTGTRRGPRPALRPGTAALVGLAASLAFIQGFGPARAVPSQGSHGPGQPPRAADGVLGEPTLTPEPADPTALPTVTPEPTEAGELPTLTPEATEMAELPTLTPDPLDPTLAPPPTTAVPPSPTRTASATPTATHTPTRLATATPTATASPSPSPTAPAVAAGSLANISTRGWVGTGDRVMIGGFIVSGGPAKVVVRARSGSLAAAGVPGLLPNPRLRLFSGQAVIAQNDDWQTGTCGAEAPAGLRPTDPREACIALTLDPGPYTAIVDDAGGRTGIALVEVFHAGGAGTLSNISTRGMVRLGDEVMIGGFIIRDHPRKVVVRARAGSLAAAGVPGLLPNPRLRLFSGQAVIAQNDDWQTGTCGAEAPAGLRPVDPREACLVMTLPPGPYTGIVDDAGGQTGIALVEVFAAD